jgi:predicted amidohydrolase YtcJ
MLEALRKATARVPKGMWITGGDWGMVAAGRAARQGKADYVAFTPDLRAIDAATPDHPVLFRRHDHAYFINSAGMRALRFTKGIADPRPAAMGATPRVNSRACSTAASASSSTSNCRRCRMRRR